MAEYQYNGHTMTTDPYSRTITISGPRGAWNVTGTILTAIASIELRKEG